MNNSPDIDNRFSTQRLAAAGAITLAASLAGVLIIRAITVSTVDVPSAFTPLQAQSVIGLTVLGVVFATIICVILNRTAGHPIDTFRRIASASFVLLFLPDIAIWVNNSYEGTATASTVIPLMLMHVAVFTGCVTLLPRLGRHPRPAAAPHTTPTNPRPNNHQARAASLPADRVEA